MSADIQDLFDKFFSDFKSMDISNELNRETEENMEEYEDLRKQGPSDKNHDGISKILVFEKPDWKLKQNLFWSAQSLRHNTSFHWLCKQTKKALTLTYSSDNYKPTFTANFKFLHKHFLNCFRISVGGNGKFNLNVFSDFR
jgi:hypothetical protein